MSLRLCNCCQFGEFADPCVSPPRERIELQHYVKHGPIQPAHGFDRNHEGRCFRAERYSQFPWLEYSVSKQAAFCFYCRLFAVESTSSGAGGQVDSAFSSTGFTNWKKALEKNRGFRLHNTCASHLFAMKGYKSFIDGKSVDQQLSEEKQREVSRREELVRQNRKTMQRLFNVVRFIARLSLPFRGHDESDRSDNRGVFLELISYLANNGDKILDDHQN